MSTIRHWTPKEDTLLRNNCNAMTNQELGDQLGRTKDAVHYRLKYLGVRRDPQKVKLRPNNKSLFKAGHVPMNTAEEGAIRTRKCGFKFYRHGKGNWEHLHRVAWRQAHGEIPHGFVVKVDGDPAAVQLGRVDNLRLVSRAELVSINREENKEKWLKALHANSLFSPTAEQYLKDNYQRYTAKQLATQLGFPERQIKNRLFALGCSSVKAKKIAKQKNNPPSATPRKGPGRKPYKALSADQLKYVHEHFQTLRLKDIANHIGISVSTLRKISDEQGLKKTGRVRIVKIGGKKVSKSNAPTITQSVRRKKAGRPRTRPIAKKNQIRFEYDPALPGNYQQQLMAWAGNQGVREISRRRICQDHNIREADLS